MPLPPFVSSDASEPRAQEVPQNELPPLRLHHLLALTAVTAIMLTLLRPQLDMPDDSELSGRSWILITVGSTIYAFLLAFAVTVVAFGIAWRWKGIRFFNQPGHWLLVAFVASYVSSTVFAKLIYAILDFGPTTYFVVQIPIVLFFVYIGLKQCTERRWSWVFFLEAVAAVVPFFGDILVLLMISRAGLYDRRLGVRRDVLHRCGVAIQILFSLLLVLLVVFVMLWFAANFWR